MSAVPLRKPARKPAAKKRSPSGKQGGRKAAPAAKARRPASRPSLRAAPARRPSKKRAAVAPRMDVSGNDPSRSLAQLVLTLVELLRQILERQAVRRLQAGSLGDEEIERMGQSFMKLERAVRRLCREFGLRFEDLRLPLRQVE